MDFRQLTYFIEVARCQSFTKASEKLHVSQPTLSKMVKNLEDDLAVELIDRSARQITLTDAGEIVLQEGQKIIESMGDLSNHLYDLMHLKRGKIKIGIPPLIDVLFFPRIIKGFKKLYPDIEIDLLERGGNKVMEEVREGLLDLGVVIMPDDETVYNCVPFHHDELNLFVHSGHRLAEREKVDMSELREEAFILFSEDFTLHDKVIEECNKAGYDPHIAYVSSQWDFISEMIGEELGISIFPQAIASKVNERLVKSVPIRPSIPWKLVTITKKGKYISKAAQVFIDFITDEQKNHV
ncbi:LysR family transcriptional regulator [Aciduricibacillus chroicocephali]|uniref:LysR family transcriptional regulator n=1 Tax=Aciduricibacillus chroicocephali TaxID=3054939 RepID=A0ABY9KX81_9BACI|nr:LysR family transcriptional regulator [Bacillaceae bacterium 44XB]